MLIMIYNDLFIASFRLYTAAKVAIFSRYSTKNAETIKKV